MEKPRLWVTYCWQDNEDRDIDFILGALEAPGEIEVHFDRRQLVPGQRLWDQIAAEISNPDKCDAWAFVAAPGSLQSPACGEELSYALDRALNSREVGFPMIGLLHRVTLDQLPIALRVRLCVPLTDANWVAQAIAGTKGVAPGHDLAPVPPWDIAFHKPPGSSPAKFTLEVRPRFERYYPARFAFPLAERERLAGYIIAPSGGMPAAVMRSGAGEGTIEHLTLGTLYLAGEDAAIDPTHSLYLHLRELPSELLIGRELPDGQTNFPFGVDLTLVRRRLAGGR